MPQYLTPGVYVEEIEAGPQPIEGVSTSITGAVGVTVLGPTSGKPVLCKSFADFTRQFGGYPASAAGFAGESVVQSQEFRGRPVVAFRSHRQRLL
jgi:phage tail sheath protein FI